MAGPRWPPLVSRVQAPSVAVGIVMSAADVASVGGPMQMECPIWPRRIPFRNEGDSYRLAGAADQSGDPPA